MFRKILIANRGEIACRIIRTAREMGIATVAVYSQADRNAVHVEMADEAVLIGAPPAAESYLVIDKIVESAIETGAEAVHPGYGFLAENAAFARSLANAGITFIGPDIRAIEVMGDKIASKKFAAQAGVNTVPGHPDVIEDAEQAVKIAADIGYPVMIKASAGGGGKGMRIAHSSGDVAQGFASAKSEALSSFGDDRILMEKFIEDPRHIEIQILADGQGNVIHLGERECSIQRRNQKIIEEAPSVFLNDELRSEMAAQALALARAVDYTSAGTVEFIADKDKKFYFLEMNTRLQVEHPVTELVTGVDIVEQMIRISAGEKLSFTQDDIELKGWAIECRIYAEDPSRNFMPSSGRLTAYRPPQQGTASGLTIRNDTGVCEGGEIPVFYDPMIAKLITHGPNREAATDHMIAALDAFYIDGIQHNISFLSAIMEHPRWVEGALTTGFVAEEYPDGFKVRAPDDETRDILTIVAAAIDHLGNLRRRKISDQLKGDNVQFDQLRVVRLGEESQKVSVSGALGQDFEIVLLDARGKERGRTCVAFDWWFGAPVWLGRLDGVEVSVQVRPILNGFELSCRGVHVPAYVYTEREAAAVRLMPVKPPPDTSKQLLCPMPGLVVEIHVKEGQQVKAGEALCVVEAMKMENILRAERDCTVAEILAKAGDSLAVDGVIMEFI